MDNDTPHRPGTVEVCLVIEPGDRPTGTITFGGECRPHPFSGWIELMAAINAARAADHDR